MSDLNDMDLDDLKKLARKLQADISKAEGVFEERMKALRDMGLKTIEEAKHRLEKLKQAEEKANKTYEKECKEFNTKWGDLLEELVGEGE